MLIFEQWLTNNQAAKQEKPIHFYLSCGMVVASSQWRVADGFLYFARAQISDRGTFSTRVEADVAIPLAKVEAIVGLAFVEHNRFVRGGPTQSGGIAA